MNSALIGLRGSIWESIIRTFTSLLFGGLFYLVWMTAFLLSLPTHTGLIEVLLWLLAPIITAVGFAIGIHYFNRLIRREKTSFLRILIWPLTGCVLGAVIVYWFGPMLIVFSMLAVGTLTVSVREIVTQGWLPD